VLRHCRAVGVDGVDALTATAGPACDIGVEVAFGSPGCRADRRVDDTHDSELIAAARRSSCSALRFIRARRRAEIKVLGFGLVVAVAPNATVIPAVRRPRQQFIAGRACKSGWRPGWPDRTPAEPRPRRRASTLGRTAASPRNAVHHDCPLPMRSKETAP
jgi:hypothetical protein